MASARQKQIKVEHLTKQVERLDGRIEKAKGAVTEAQQVVTDLEKSRETLVQRLKWQQSEPVDEVGEDDPPDA